MFNDGPTDRVLDDLKQLRDRLVKLEEEISSKARDGAQQAERYVHDNPWQAMGIAAGIGLVIGVLLGRPRR